MVLTIIVKVLGRKVGFNALLNQVLTLWSLGNRFQLMDLENEFTWLDFKKKDGFNKVLMIGPWVSFGCYLMVRSWSSDFSTVNDNLDKQVVWIQLLGLLEGFYSNFLLRAIGQVIGLIVKIDAHTTATVKGRLAQMAVSSLYLGCQVTGVEADVRKNMMKERRRGSLEIKTGGVNYVSGLHFLVLEIDGTKTDTTRLAVMEGIFDGDVNGKGIVAKIMGKKEANVAINKCNSRFNSARAKEK
ncbi:hypothetical protein GOBAR_AA39427 [Gossypium barbadense]|uniref:DUF4283 domain-containing protein n=1 Tax=Gossypium barbadense TaxID=3634 RepID=A0A2P5VR16_GOSBA|nr:hypothetical protein GOBAR_AA39427 [Gossypium barbadense]